jgi:hypothetical protein
MNAATILALAGPTIAGVLRDPAAAKQNARDVASAVGGLAGLSDSTVDTLIDRGPPTWLTFVLAFSAGTIVAVMYAPKEWIGKARRARG